jgi:hypothetical protein
VSNPFAGTGLPSTGISAPSSPTLTDTSLPPGTQILPDPGNADGISAVGNDPSTWSDPSIDLSGDSVGN